MKKSDHAKLDWSVVPPDWIPAMKEWITYKEERREYYVPSGWVKLISKLKKEYSNVSDLQEAIDSSMAQTYMGIFPAKKKVTSSFTGNYSESL